MSLRCSAVRVIGFMLMCLRHMVFQLALSPVLPVVHTVSPSASVYRDPNHLKTANQPHYATPSFPCATSDSRPLATDRKSTWQDSTKDQVQAITTQMAPHNPRRCTWSTHTAFLQPPSRDQGGR